MADPEPSDSEDDEPGMPRWAKIGVIITVIVVLVLVIGKAAGIEHGAGQHSSSDKTKTETTNSSDAGHKPPVGGHG